MVNDSVSVVIPHIPVRSSLAAAVDSVAKQTYPVDEIIIATDVHRHGSAVTRNRALSRVATEWVAFLDDDDYLLPDHIETLVSHARETGVDVAYAGCRVTGPDGENIPLQEEWGRFGKPFDGELLRQASHLPVTSLVRTKMAQQAWFGPPAGVDTPYDDWGFYLRLLDLGATFSHVPKVTWVWSHHGKNTSGQPDRW